MVTSDIVAKPRPWIERLAAAILSAVVIGRLLTPTDAAPAGETLWIAQLSLLGFLVWAVAAWRSQPARWRFNWVDAAAGLLCLGHVVGALVVVATSGDKRAATTMLWEWIGVGVTWFLMRQLLETLAERQGMLLVVTAAAVSLSGMGIWQHHIGFAETRRMYEKLKAESADPTNSRRASARAEFARLGIPDDESARILWEQRLYSGEPIGMFALANTLAGILVGASFLWMGALLRAGRAVPVWLLVLGGMLTVLILYCLLLTKSRTAYVALGCGMGLWSLVEIAFRRTGLRRIWLALVAAAAVIFALVAVAVVTGGLDTLVFTESTKSLRYRFEYWSSTWQMLQESPRNWLAGVGPGNFRQHYLQFKLPQSSEEIADPHDLVLDVWANGGLLALAGLAGLCYTGLRPLWSTLRTGASRAAGLQRGDGIIAGALLGHLAASFVGLGDEEIFVLLLLGWLLVVYFCCALFRYEQSPCVYGAAFAALFVHLLGAGGIGMPAISQMLLFLVVLGGGDTLATTGWKGDQPSWLSRSAMFLFGLVLFLGCLIGGLMPISICRSKIAEGDEMFGKQNLPQAERKFQLAAEADRWSPVPWERLSGLAYQRWLAAGPDRPDEFERSVECQRQAIARDPRNAAGYRALADLYLAQFQRSRQPADASAAVVAMC